jgi:DNA polymerase
LGATPTQRLLAANEGILKLRGTWRDFHGRPLLATLHPAYLLRQPAQKRLAWRDFLSLKRRLVR